MITIKDLTVSITYRVGLGDVDVPDRVYKELINIYENGGETHDEDFKNSEATEWLMNNIRQKDCMDWSAEIEELETYEND